MSPAPRRGGRSPKKSARKNRPARGAQQAARSTAAQGPTVPSEPGYPAEVYRRLLENYPNAHCELDYRNPYELLVATILSAQCTDKRVNMVTPELFRRYPDAESLAGADPDELEDLIRSTGFFRNKRKSLMGMAAAVAQDHAGSVPSRLEELVRLPGVGRKTANVVLGNAFGLNEGVVVDTHVERLSQRLGLTRETTAVRIEEELMQLFPRETWAMLAHLLIWHGRRTCMARQPKCSDCFLADICPSAPKYL